MDSIKKIKNDESVIALDKISSSNWENIKDTAIVTHIAEIKTSMGMIVLGLYGEDAPETVANFIGLAKMNYYAGVLFHRVAKDFLIQTGDRNTLYINEKNEWGFGGESFYGGEIEDELNPNTVSYKRGYEYGVVAMANKGANTNTSQFFICLKEAKKLERKWTIFGKVVDGMNNVEKIANCTVEPSERGKNDGIPLKPIRIYSVTISLIKAPELK
jgi:cyclophilin family peptidyl-prolyl cis-trans isomerase